MHGRFHPSGPQVSPVSDNPKAFKHWFNADVVAEMATALCAAYPEFPKQPFLEDATNGLTELELKERVAHIAAALHTHLPDDPREAMRIIRDSLPPPMQGTDGVSESVSFWPLCHYVETCGLEHLDDALSTIHVLTQRFSCEFAIRPYIERYPAEVYERLSIWAADPNPHVRRLVSEGTRPRLPWGRRLTALQKDPAPSLVLLERLKDDPEEYVRRSVANHLNDIAKDHPDLAVDVTRRWIEGASAPRLKLIRHALRGLVKAGHRGALAVLGYGPPRIDATGPNLSTDVVQLGDTMRIAYTLTSTSDEAQSLVVDYAVHHQKKNGSTAPKVFKWASFTLKPGETRSLAKKHAFKRITTRTYYTGTHRVEILVNGESHGNAEFELRVDG